MANLQLGAVLQHLRRLAARKHEDDATDGQLLERFARQRDESAFAALLRRHGPMVLGVCRRLLGHEQDAEDVFQATFLVLARRAAALRDQTALSAFLHGTACHLASKAKRAAGRRRKYEDNATSQAPADPVDELSWREVRTLLDEEIARLPEKYRSVFVLCVLEGASREEAAMRLGLKAGTVSSRLTMARKRLGQRLTHRGVELTAVLAATTVMTPPASALPIGLMASTIEAALATAAGEGLSGIVSASAAELVHSATTAMMVSKTKIATAILLIVATSGSLVGWYGRASGPLAATTEPPADKAKVASPKRQAAKTVEIQGRVVDADGKPFPAAKVYFLARHRRMQVEPGPDFARVRAIADAHGRFQFRVARCQLQPSEDEEVRFIQNTHPNDVVTAVGAGHGPAWAAIGKIDEAGHLTLKLAKDDVPIRGRVLDLEGRPIPGVKVRVMLVTPMRTESLQPWLDELQKKKDGSAIWKLQGAEIYPEAAGLEKAAVTDSEGRFQLRGVGRERVARLRFEGPTIESRDVLVRTRPGPTFELPYPSLPPSKDKFVYYGAAFEHAAAPTVPFVGTIRDKDTGKPLAGIIVQARIPSAEGGPDAEGGPASDYMRTVSDKDGRYRLVGLPKRPGQIIRAYSGPNQAYVRLGKRTSAGIGLGPTRLDFELKRGVRIHGRVTDKATGQPVKAEVEYFIFSENPEHVEGAGGFREGSSINTWTGEDGSFSLVGLPRRGILAAKDWSATADRYIVAAGAEQIEGAIRNYWFATYPYVCKAERFHSLREVNPAKDAGAVLCNIAIDSGKTVTGILLGPEGKPLQGIRIEGPRGIGPRDPQRLKTARFTATAINPKAPRWFFFFHKEKQLGAAVRLTGNEAKDFAVRLQPCATITGRVVDSDGRPRSGLELAGVLEGGQNGPSEGWGGFWGVKTDKEGRFRVSALIPGLKWRVVYIQEGFMLTGQLLRNMTFQAGETKDLGDLQVKPIEEE